MKPVVANLPPCFMMRPRLLVALHNRLPSPKRQPLLVTKYLQLITVMVLPAPQVVTHPAEMLCTSTTKYVNIHMYHVQISPFPAAQ
jgi:hypothetical protein